MEFLLARTKTCRNWQTVQTLKSDPGGPSSASVFLGKRLLGTRVPYLGEEGCELPDRQMFMNIFALFPADKNDSKFMGRKIEQEINVSLSCALTKIRFERLQMKMGSSVAVTGR